MSLCDASDQFERTEGVKSQAVIRSDLSALLLLGNFADSGQENSLGCAVRKDVEYIFFLGKIFLREGKQLFGETVVLNAGIEIDTVIAGHIG